MKAIHIVALTTIAVATALLVIGIAQGEIEKIIFSALGYAHAGIAIWRLIPRETTRTIGNEKQERAG